MNENSTVDFAPVVILPMNGASVGEIRFVENILLRVFSLRSVLLPTETLSPSLFNVSRNQWDADKLLDLLFNCLPDQSSRIIGVLGEDMFAAGRTFVFGYANLRNGTAVISAARLREEWYGRRPDVGLLQSRIGKVVVHEVGHTFGNPHHEVGGCVMCSVVGIENLDDIHPSMCPSCWEKVAQGRQIDPLSAEGRILRAGAYFRYKQFGLAVSAYREAIRLAPTKARYYNDLGVALLATGDRDGALVACIHAAHLAPPDLPHPFYNVGIMLMEGRGREEIVERWLNEGIRRDPDKLNARRFVGKLYKDLSSDLERARRYYQAYVDLGGTDPFCWW